MKKSLLLAIVALILIVGAIAFVKSAQIMALIDMGENATEPPVTVSSYAVTADRWASSLSAIGSLEAAKGLLITADLEGRIAKIHFNAGQEVQAGDLLIEQDISTERAQLRAAQAALNLAKSDLDRIRELFRKQVASKSELDRADSSYRSAAADVDNIRATIEKKSIRAPFAGKLGIRLVNLGQSINAGDAVVSLQATNQMFVNFFLPQQLLSQVSVGLPVTLTSDAVPGESFSGAINAIDPEIDVNTRSIKLQGILTNDEQKLLPGMFASIDVLLPGEKPVLMIPITAVQYATFGDSVFIIEEANDSEPDVKNETENETVQATAPEIADSENASTPLRVRQQFVKLGETRGDFVAVDKGLEEGQQVVSAGVFKLRKGAPVVINNDVAPEYKLEPDVDDN